MKKTLFAAAITSAAFLTASAANTTPTKPDTSRLYAHSVTVVGITNQVTVQDFLGNTWSFDAAETFGCDPFSVGDKLDLLMWDSSDTADMTDDTILDASYDCSNYAQ